MSRSEVRVPDIGEFDSVDVIEVLVAPGDSVSVEQSLITLESDKATMEIPSPVAGVVVELAVEVGSHVSEGDLIARLELAAGARGRRASACERRVARNVEHACGCAAIPLRPHPVLRSQRPQR